MKPCNNLLRMTISQLFQDGFWSLFLMTLSMLVFCTHQKIGMNSRQLQICTLSRLHYFKRFTHRHCALDKDPKLLNQNSPIPTLQNTCSETLIIQSSQETNGSRDKWGSSQRSGRERRGNKLHKELLAQLSPEVSLLLNEAFIK